MTKSAELESFPFKHHYLQIDGSQMHYIDEGHGNPIVFVHGMPTSSYLWRHIIPSMVAHGRCIAPDLIGMGLSDKPTLDYSLETHCHFFNEFIDKLKLKNITLFVHGWGSVIGLDYASKHPNNIKGLVFFESYLRPIESWQDVPLPLQQQAQILNQPDGGYELIINSDYFVDTALSSGMIGDLPNNTVSYYRKLLQNENSKRLLWQFIQDMPLGDGPDDTVDIMRHYCDWLKDSPIPKLLFYGIPGFLTPIKIVEWAKENLPNLTVVDIGESNHYSIETQPEAFAAALQAWFLSNVKG